MPSGVWGGGAPREAEGWAKALGHVSFHITDTTPAAAAAALLVSRPTRRSTRELAGTCAGALCRSNVLVTRPAARRVPLPPSRRLAALWSRLGQRCTCHVV